MADRVRAATAREVAALLHDAPFDEAPALMERYAEDPRAQVRKAVEALRRRYAREAAERSQALGGFIFSLSLNKEQ